MSSRTWSKIREKGIRVCDRLPVSYFGISTLFRLIERDRGKIFEMCNCKNVIVQLRRLIQKRYLVVKDLDMRAKLLYYD